MKANKRSLSIADVVGNDDLLIEILAGLPAKSVIKFQLVSKHWRSLISVRSFSVLHTLRFFRRPKPQPSFLLRTRHSLFYIFHPTINRLIPFCFKIPNVNILQSCNGLLLLECTYDHCTNKEYYVCNPTTMQCRNLHLKLQGALAGLCLVFDPCKSSHYMVVSFKREIRSHYIQFSVYDSETQEWKKRSEFERKSSRFLDGIYWNDRIYFIKGSSPFCFSLKDEKINAVPKHPRISGRNQTCTMESNGHLHYVVLSLKTEKNCLYVFEMDYSGWFEKYRAYFNPIIVSASLCDGRDISLFGLVRGEREEDSILLFYVRGRIMIYRFFDKVFEVMVDLSKEDQLLFDFEVDAYQYIESLARV